MVGGASKGVADGFGKGPGKGKDGSGKARGGWGLGGWGVQS